MKLVVRQARVLQGERPASLFSFWSIVGGKAYKLIKYLGSHFTSKGELRPDTKEGSQMWNGFWQISCCYPPRLQAGQVPPISILSRVTHVCTWWTLLPTRGRTLLLVYPDWARTLSFHKDQISVCLVFRYNNLSSESIFLLFTSCNVVRFDLRDITRW